MSGIYPVDSFLEHVQPIRVAINVSRFDVHNAIYYDVRRVYDAMARYLDVPSMCEMIRNRIASLIPKDYDCCTFEEDGSCILLFVMMNFKNHRGMFNTILKYCNDFNSVNQNGESFLHLLRYLDEYSPFMEEYVSELIRKGADTKLKDKQGKTPFMKALEAQNFILARLLFNYHPQKYLIHSDFLYETVFHHIIRLPVYRETPSFMSLLNRVFILDRTVMNRTCPMSNTRPIQDIIEKGFYNLLHKFIRNNAKLTFPISEFLYYSAFGHAKEKRDARAFWILYQSLTAFNFDPLAPVPVMFFNDRWVYRDTYEPLEENLISLFLDPRESIASKTDPVYHGSSVAAGIIGK